MGVGLRIWWARGPLTHPTHVIWRLPIHPTYPTQVTWDRCRTKILECAQPSEGSAKGRTRDRDPPFSIIKVPSHRGLEKPRDLTKHT